MSQVTAAVARGPGAIVSRREEPLPKRLEGIQMLRAVAVIVVCAWHTVAIYEPARYHIPSVLFFGYAGVDLFFVISGFIMMHIVRFVEPSFGLFMAKRVARILPSYWLVTTLILCVGLVKPAFVSFRGREPIEYVLQSYLLAPISDRPLLSVGWSLQHEFIFYFIIGGCATLASKLYAKWVILALFLVGVLVHVVFREQVYAALGFNFDFKLFSLYHLEFLAGMLSYEFLSRYRIERVALLAVAGTVLMFATGWLVAHIARDMPMVFGRVIPIGIHGLVRVTGFSIASAVVLVALAEVSMKNMAWRTLVLVGNASFSVYLVHDPAIKLAGKILSRFVHGMPAYYAMATVLVVLGVAAGVVFHLLVERPLVRICEGPLKRVSPNRTQQSVAA